MLPYLCRYPDAFDFIYSDAHSNAFSYASIGAYAAACAFGLVDSRQIVDNLDS